MDLAADLLRVKICRSRFRGGEQQVGSGVDGGAIFLLGPRQTRIVGPETSFDVGDWHLRHEARQSRSQRARRVALYDKQVRPFAEQGKYGGRDGAHMAVRVQLARTVEAHDGIIPEVELLGIQVRMLTRKHDRGPTAAGGQCVCDRGHLDCYRPGADHQPDLGGTQYSP